MKKLKGRWHRIGAPNFEPVTLTKDQKTELVNNIGIRQGNMEAFIVNVEWLMGEYLSDYILEKSHPSTKQIRGGIDDLLNTVCQLEQQLILINEGTGYLIGPAIKEIMNDDHHAFVQKIRKDLEVLRQAAYKAKKNSMDLPNKVPKKGASAREILACRLGDAFIDRLNEQPTTSREGKFENCLALIFRFLSEITEEKELTEFNKLTCFAVKTLKSDIRFYHREK